ncbi:hypothetical protein [Arthrobacter sp. ISL-28]|uniref:hypothetical protein n=1 Tax=Arthrobacter sp. ISL-28 TaxID=2819108 RepID=UPI001BED381D|nr:hypothetical protein [Arthrobacter sp. ISL-28]MBT2521808.1 hypothetical protein [Arthrobacter sp. ISL-28]
MTTEQTLDATKLTESCRAIFGNESTWITANGYPGSLALCIIDSIFSTGSHYQSVINVIDAYCDIRKEGGGDPHRDGVEELLASFNKVGGSAGWAKAVDNHKPAHTKPGALLKAEVIHQAALALKGLEGGGIFTTADMHAEFAKDAELERVKRAWLHLPSQRSGVTYNYLLILAGFQSVKPDRMVIRFVAEHVGLDGKNLTAMETANLIKQVAELYPTQPRRLDHVIWRHVSGREVFREDDLN